MIRVAKRVVRHMLNTIGYDIVARQSDDYVYGHVPYNPNTVPIEVYERHYPADSIRNRRFYNVGAGTFRHPYWTNIDYASDWYAKAQTGGDMINFDLFSLGQLPIEDASAEVVYTSHTVEHVNDPAVMNMMKEAWRILKPGGVFRMTTPNIDLDLRAYRSGDRDHFYYLGLYSHPSVIANASLDPQRPFLSASLQQLVLFSFASSTTVLVADKTSEKITDEEFDHVFSTMSDENALNHCVSKCSRDVQSKYPGYHMNWWNPEKATRMLRAAGFSNVYQSAYGQSASPILRDVTLFDVQDPKLSLYVEAVKS